MVLFTVLLIFNLVVCVVAAKILLNILFSTAGVISTVTFLFVFLGACEFCNDELKQK